MDVYALAAQKGGVGKTTLAEHLAVEAAQAGPVVLVDTDPQGSLGHWWAARAEDQLHFADAQPRQLPALLKQWQDLGVKAVFLDTPPAISETIREVVQLSDLVVVPTKPSPHDLRAVVGTMRLRCRYRVFRGHGDGGQHGYPPRYAAGGVRQRAGLLRFDVAGSQGSG